MTGDGLLSLADELDAYYRTFSADEAYGGAPWWRQALAEMGLIYVVEVPSRVYGWIGERRGAAQPLPRLAARHPSVRCGRKARFTTHETGKGAEVWEGRRVRFIEQAQAGPSGEQALLVARNMRTEEVKYFLSNAPRTMSTGACLKVAFSRWRVERCFQGCKSELGLNHAELRTCQGLRRHLILTAINYYFFLNAVVEAGEKKSDRLAAGRRRASDRRAAHRGHHERRTAAAVG